MFTRFVRMVPTMVFAAGIGAAIPSNGSASAGSSNDVSADAAALASYPLTTLSTQRSH